MLDKLEETGTQDGLVFDIKRYAINDGPGIRAQHRERIFERFYRIDPGRSRAVGGTGLGLAICRHLVESMGGRIGFEPRDQTGSRFWLTLPRGAADEEVRLAG